MYFFFLISLNALKPEQILCAIIAAYMKNKLQTEVNWLSWPSSPPSPYLIPSPDSILPIPCLTFPIKNPTDRKLEYHDRRLYPNTYYIFKSCKEITFILTMQQIAQEYFPSLSISDHFTLDIRFHQFSKTNLTQACLRYMSDRKRPLSKLRFYPQ